MPNNEKENEMIPDLHEKLRQYVTAFNDQDVEMVRQVFPNSDAYEFLSEQVPLLECPDETIEKTYYYRFWTIRKHWKETPEGHILTEFLPNVSWGGPYNSINAAFWHHIREARWFKDPNKWVKEYINFWLDRKGISLDYSSWYAATLEDYFRLHPDPAFEAECIDRLVSLYEERERTNAHPCGLFWSNDDHDAMEMSISGSGIRPTLNSYMAADARAIARFAARAGRMDLSRKYDGKARDILEKMDRLLWDGDFYKVIPCEIDEAFDGDHRPPVHPDHDVREEIGFIPWMFHLPGPDKSVAFRHLTDEEGFAAPCGITTAERRHPRFMYSHGHECLWNGPVWPFATSQTLAGLSNHLRDHGEVAITKKDYYHLLRQYAACHRTEGPDGTDLMWIDENLDPFDGEWTARAILKKRNNSISRGGPERGKDYNHSCFCDLVLSGLLGIEAREGQLTVDPIIPEDWDYFCVTNLTDRNLTVLFDRTGKRYGFGAGLFILGQ